MHQPHTGIADELQRQLQLSVATADRRHGEQAGRAAGGGSGLADEDDVLNDDDDSVLSQHIRPVMEPT